MAKDYVEIGAVTALGIFNTKVAEMVQKYNKLYKPFDEPCARLDFRDKVEAMERESERKYGFIKVDELTVNIDKLDLDQYAEDDKFVFVEDQEDVTEKFLDGTRTRVVLGHTVTYKCKARGHGISLFIPLADYKDRDTKPVKTTKIEGKDK